jgi:Protein of unknown function (DUF1488)
MSLSFPNQSRSYDVTLRAVRFWGHDGALEVAFFVNEDSLKRIEPRMQPNESGLLNAFDSHRDLIIRGYGESLSARPKGIVRTNPPQIFDGAR